MASLANTEITNTFDVWRRNTNEVTDRLNSITTSGEDNRITLTGNVEVGGTNFVVDSGTNRVGVGTSTPAVKLDVVGETNISADLKVDTDTLYVNSTTDRVGINNATPTEALDVTGKTLISDDLMISGAASNVLFVDTSNSSIGINVDAPTAGSLEVSGNVVLQNSDSLRIKTSDGTLQTVLTANTSNSTILQGSGGTESIVLASSNGTSRITMTEAGVTAFTANVSIPDNEILFIGNDNDLRIFHDGSDSFIKDLGTGNFYLDSDGPGLYLRVNSTQTAIAAVNTGEVSLRYATAEKLGTTSAGVNITGTATISSLTDNRITFAGTAGVLEDSTDLTFDGTTFEIGGGYGGTGVDIDMLGNISADGTVTVDGLSSLDGGIDVNSAAFTVSAAGAVDTSTTLTVDGLSSLDGGIDVNAANFTVATSGAVDTASTLTVDGLSSLDGGIDVNGAFIVATDGGVTVSDTLDVTGITAFSANTVFDTDTLFVDSVNDRVGINKIPTQPLDVTGNILSSATIEGTTITDGTATMTGGTVSATQFTTGSFNGTTGTFSGNLTVDTNVLYVDAASNEVGINTSSPGFDLDVNGDINVTGTIKASGSSTAGYYLKVNSNGNGMEYEDIQAVFASNGVVSKPLSAPFPNAIGNERDVTMWQSNTVITGNTNMLTYDLSTGQLNVKSNGTGSAILSIQDTGAGNNAELVKDDSDLKIRSGGGNIKFSGATDSTNIGDFQVYSGGALQNIMHTGNGGPGTNFDADLLDGQQGSEYSRLVNTTSASTAGGYNEIIRWAAGTNSDTAVVLTLLITSNRSDLDDYNGSCSALVQVSLVQNSTGSSPELESDIQLLSYSSYGSGSTEDIIEDILIASTGTTVDPPSTQSVYIKSKIVNEVFTVQVLSESKTGSNVQDVTYPSSSWTTVPSNIQAQTGKIVRQSADFLPKRNNVYDLGSTTDRWAAVNSVLGNFSGTVTGPNGTWDSGGIDISGGVITGPSGTWDSGGIDIASGDTYAINGTNVLTATTLGSGVTSSSLTSVGTLNSGSISSGFGNINIGSSIFTGNGSGLTNIVAANISTGSLADGVNLHYTEDNATATAYFVSFTNANGLDGSGNKDSLFSDKFSFTPSTGRITSNQISVDASGLIIGGSAVTATAAELNELDGIGTPTDGGIVYGDGTGLKVTAAGTTGQYLRSAGTGIPIWDTINLGTDTAGNYMVDTSGGSGITVTHTPSEGSTATIAVDLSDTNIFASDGTVSRAVVLDGSGNFSAGTITASLSGTATTATNVTTTDNTATNETVYVAFVDGTTGGQGIEVDSTGLTYNPSTNTLTVANLSGTATNLSRSVIAGTGLTGGGTLNGDVTLDVIGGDGIDANADDIAVDSTVVRTTRTVTAGTGLTGGGALSGDITLNVVGGDGIDANADDIAVDTSVLRTNVSQSISQDKIFQDNVELYFGTGSTTDAWMYWDGSHLVHKSWGNVYFDFNSAANDDFIIRDGTVTRLTLDATTGDLTLATGDFIASSDARVKDNIETITDSIGVLNQLRPVSYTRKDHVDKETKHYGLIAQEVMDVLPAIVHGSEEDGYKLSYIQLISHLIEGIQTLDKRVKELENGN